MFVSKTSYEMWEFHHIYNFPAVGGQRLTDNISRSKSRRSQPG